MKDKHYWAMYYDIDENLPDDEFYAKIKEINIQCEQKTKEFIDERKTHKTD